MSAETHLTTDPGFPEFALDAALVPTRIRGYHDVMTLRLIRNTCRDGFAHDTAEISPTQQVKWWHANEGRLIAFLYRNLYGFPVGYALLREEGGAWWSSVAILPHHSGKGYGKAVTRHIVRQSPAGVVYAQARKDHPAADK